MVIKSKRLVDDGTAGSTVHTVNGAGNNLAFTTTTITAETAGTYANVQVGQRIKINNTSTENDGKIFTVASVDATGTTITVASDETLDANTTPVTTGTVELHTQYFDFDPSERKFLFRRRCRWWRYNLVRGRWCQCGYNRPDRPDVYGCRRRPVARRHPACRDQRRQQRQYLYDRLNFYRWDDSHFGFDRHRRR